MPLKRASIAVTLNIALRPRSGDLIVMNAGLAKPIPPYLLYSMAAHRAGLFALWRAPAFARISIVRGTYRRDNWSRSRPHNCVYAVLRRTIGRFSGPAQVLCASVPPTGPICRLYAVGARYAFARA